MSWLAELSPDEWSAIRLSLKVSLTAALATLPVAMALAFALARGRFPGKALLDGLILLPLVLPPVVTGYVLLILFGRRGPIGAFLDETFGIVLAFRWTGAALACAIMGLPLMVRTMRLAIEGVDRRLEAAAGTLGANRLQSLVFVTLPLIWPGILAGFVLGFAKAMGEFGATITFVANIPGETQTLPSAIYSLTQTPGGDGAALRLTLVSIIVSLGAVLVSEFLVRRAARRRRNDDA
jgi:molybdate transport system permease protein